jgi:hypothetical protein
MGAMMFQDSPESSLIGVFFAWKQKSAVEDKLLLYLDVVDSAEWIAWCRKAAARAIDQRYLPLSASHQLDRGRIFHVVLKESNDFRHNTCSLNVAMEYTAKHQLGVRVRSLFTRR